jgi:phosphate transport system substrate-binding protein
VGFFWFTPFSEVLEFISNSNKIETMKSNLFLLIICVSLFFSCQTQEENAALDTPTSGSLTVFADEGLKNMLENQAYTFMKIYSKAKINFEYTEEANAIKSLQENKCKTIAISRNLSEKEENWFKQSNITLNKSFIGKSAIVFIASKEVSDSVISTTLLKQLLSGDTSKTFYKSCIFENKQSSSAVFLRDSLIKETIGKNCYAAENFNDLIQRIQKNTHALGVIDYAHISDSDDSISKYIKANFKIIAVSKNNENLAYYPDQSNIQTGDYPFTRSIYLIRRGQDFSLAAGFITYVAGPSGQVILLKTGFAPWRQPERVISINLNN